MILINNTKEISIIFIMSFNLIFQKIMYDMERNQYIFDNNYDRQEQKNHKKEKQFRSLIQFKHFCDNLGLTFDQPEKDEKSKENYNFIQLFLLNNNNNKQRFNFFNKYNPTYFNKYKKIFTSIQKFLQNYTITIDGTKDGIKILIS